MPDELQRLTGALADRYRIEREFGSGGMATDEGQGFQTSRVIVVLNLLRELEAEASR